MDPPAEPPVLNRRRDGDVLFLRLARPRLRNAINGPLLHELETALAEAAVDSELRIVVLQGEGGYFCSGGDLKERARIAAEQDADAVARRNAHEGRLLLAIAFLPQLVIAAVEGGAVGAGLGILCACDLVLAREGSRFAAPEVADGAIPAQIMPYLVRRAGSQARRLLLTGTPICAAEAHRIGLVHEVLPADAEIDQALAQRLAQLSRCDAGAIAATKTLLARFEPFDAGYPDEAAALYQSRMRNGASRARG